MPFAIHKRTWTKVERVCVCVCVCVCVQGSGEGGPLGQPLLKHFNHFIYTLLQGITMQITWKGQAAEREMCSLAVFMKNQVTVCTAYSNGILMAFFFSLRGSLVDSRFEY